MFRDFNPRTFNRRNIGTSATERPQRADTSSSGRRLDCRLRLVSMNEGRTKSMKEVALRLVGALPPFRVVLETRRNQTPVTFRHLVRQWALVGGRGPYWPVHETSVINNWKNVYAGVDVSPGYSPGCYIQALKPVVIGDYTQIGPNVGLIGANHSVYDSRKHTSTEGIRIGSYCWIGMNAVILPGVVLGDFTIVGAGAIVTKSFADGYGVLAGNPARQIKILERDLCRRFKNEHEYNGFIPACDFPEFRRAFLSV